MENLKNESEKKKNEPKSEPAPQQKKRPSTLETEEGAIGAGE